jgi:hypothetical protein
MKKNAVWYGFLQAGKKSSPVVLDASLETKTAKTIYLFNYIQGKFLEYSREIVEPKLQELGPDDQVLKELKSAFKTARKTFMAERGAQKRAIATARSKARADHSDVEDIPDMIPEDTSDRMYEGDYAE